MKNKLSDLNDYLFETLDRVCNPDLTPEEIESEKTRTGMICSVADTILRNASVQLSVIRHADDYGYNQKRKDLPELLS